MLQIIITSISIPKSANSVDLGISGNTEYSQSMTYLASIYGRGTYNSMYSTVADKINLNVSSNNYIRVQSSHLLYKQAISVGTQLCNKHPWLYSLNFLLWLTLDLLLKLQYTALLCRLTAFLLTLNTTAALRLTLLSIPSVKPLMMNWLAVLSLNTSLPNSYICPPLHHTDMAH